VHAKKGRIQDNNRGNEETSAVTGQIQEQNQVTRTDFRSIVGIEQWDTHWQNGHKVQGAMRGCTDTRGSMRLAIHHSVKQAMAQVLRSIIKAATAAVSNIGWSK
jgi:hypothetical protein